jgi:hypothetical protein
MVHGPSISAAHFSRTEFVQQYPIATKRIGRAFQKATNLCVSEPARVARLMVERGYTDRYDYALQTLRELPFGVWRDHDPEDTIRFFTLRMNEAGRIKADPQRSERRHPAGAIAGKRLRHHHGNRWGAGAGQRSRGSALPDPARRHDAEARWHRGDEAVEGGG